MSNHRYIFVDVLENLGLDISNFNGNVYSKSSFMAQCPRCNKRIPMTELETVCCKCKKEMVKETDDLFYRHTNEQVRRASEKNIVIENNICINHNDM